MARPKRRRVKQPQGQLSAGAKAAIAQILGPAGNVVAGQLSDVLPHQLHRPTPLPGPIHQEIRRTISLLERVVRDIDEMSPTTRRELGGRTLLDLATGRTAFDYLAQVKRDALDAIRRLSIGSRAPLKRGGPKDVVSQQIASAVAAVLKVNGVTVNTARRPPNAGPFAQVLAEVLCDLFTDESLIENRYSLLKHGVAFIANKHPETLAQILDFATKRKLVIEAAESALVYEPISDSWPWIGDVDADIPPAKS